MWYKSWRSLRLYLLVREASLLDVLHQLLVEGGQLLLADLLRHIVYVLALVQEPRVDVRQVVDLLNAVALLKGLRNGVGSALRGHREGIQKIIKRLGLKAGVGRVHHANCLLKRLFKRAAHSHHLANLVQ